MITEPLLEKYIFKKEGVKYIVYDYEFDHKNNILISLSGVDEYYTIPLLDYITFVFNSCNSSF